MAKILVKAFDIPAAEKKTPFKDAVGVFGPYINDLYAAGITSGKTADLFGTNSEITRGEFAVLLYKAVMKYGYVIKPELAITGDTGWLTNITKQTLTIKASKGSDIKLLVNNHEVRANAEGTYDFTLREGENNITATATLFGVATTVTKRIILDTIPPSLKGPELPDVVYSPELKIYFEAEPGAGVQVKVNGVEMYYATILNFQEGENTVVIRVGDAAGNQTIVEKIITYVK